VFREWNANGSEEWKILKARKTNAFVVNNVVYNWFCVARKQHTKISGPLLQQNQKALEVSEELEISNFKASNGWLVRFRSRYNTCFKTICGESKVHLFYDYNFF